MKPKLFIATPTRWDINPYTHGTFAYNLAEAYKHLDIEITEPRMYDDRPLSVARERAGEDLLDSDCTHVLTYDTDQVFYTGTFTRLIGSALEADVPIVAGWSLARKSGGPVLLLFERMFGERFCDPDDFSYYQPYSMRKFYSRSVVKTSYGPLVKVDGIGFGLVLIRRDTFERMKRPWFLEWSPVMKSQAEDFGEDLWFGDRALQAGIPTYVNRSCFMGHWAKQGYIIGYEHLQKMAMVEGIIDIPLTK